MRIRDVRSAIFAATVLAAPNVMAQGTMPADQPATAPPATTEAAPTRPDTTSPGTSADQADSNTLLGREVFSQDQTRMGKVEKVMSASDGHVQAILIRTGGFLGFGAKMVSIPQGRFSLRGLNVQLELTSDEVQQLPAEKDAS